ncbi:hypothetical protein D4765_07140 [Subtercola vilae]|uniref:YncE family protein n=2 Tax=Microbacteriaceae TaxID=85023 RepID=A0A4T2C2X9_9MICO|nr:hypothetical protein D4765_07140 [Subtercola vilae]
MAGGIAGLAGSAQAVVHPAAYASLPRGAEPGALVVDTAGDVFTVNPGTNSVSKVLAGGRLDPRFDGTLPSGSLPVHIAEDAAGALYVTSFTTSTVVKLDPDTGLADSAFTAHAGAALAGRHPVDVAISPAGAIFVLNSGDETVVELSAAGDELAVAALDPVADSQALAFDDHGDLFVANTGDGTISRITYGTAGPASVTRAWATLDAGTYPTGLAFDHHDHVYAVSAAGASVYEIGEDLPIGLNLMSRHRMPGTYPFAITNDLIGNVYTSNIGDNTISMFGVDGSVIDAVTTLTGSPSAEAIVADRSGSLFTANTATDSVGIAPLAPVITSAAPPSAAQVDVAYRAQITATGLDPTVFAALEPLPSGLSLDRASGVLSGTPTVAGTFDLDVSAANLVGRSDVQHVSLVIAPRAGSTGCWYWSGPCGL